MKKLWLVFVLGLFVACVNQSTNKVHWNEEMQNLSEILSQLLPLSLSRELFAKPQNRKEIQEKIGNFNAIAKKIVASHPPYDDPTLEVVSQMFEEELERAERGYQAGHHEYARHLVRQAATYCIQCHTQTDRGGSRVSLDIGLKNPEMPPPFQAKFFAATHQFDRALDAYQKALNDKTLQTENALDWEQEARAALSILVRALNNPERSLDFLKAINTEHLRPPQKKLLQQWKKNIQQWKTEQKDESNPDALFQKARLLIQGADKSKDFAYDHSQDIDYFRALGHLHALSIRKDLDRNRRSEILLWSGIATEAIRDMNFWTLHESYYEMCIRNTPHTHIAARCFEHLRASIELGYSGSGGVHLPPDVRQHLERLRSLSAPKK